MKVDVKPDQMELVLVAGLCNCLTYLASELLEAISLQIETQRLAVGTFLMVVEFPPVAEILSAGRTSVSIRGNSLLLCLELYSCVGGLDELLQQGVMSFRH